MESRPQMMRARANPAHMAIVNLSETPFDDVRDVLIRGKAGEVLPGIVVAAVHTMRAK